MRAIIRTEDVCEMLDPESEQHPETDEELVALAERCRTLSLSDPDFAEVLEAVNEKMSALNLRLDAQRYLRHNDIGFPESEAAKMWMVEDVTCSILHRTDGCAGREWFNGYVRFPKPPVAERGYGGFLRFIPVHGGITYYNDGLDGSKVYGFDCNHLDDVAGQTPWTNDVDWMTEETERLARALMRAGDWESVYLQWDDPHYRAHIIERYHQSLVAQGIEFVLTDNFAAMLAVLSGDL